MKASYLKIVFCIIFIICHSTFLLSQSDLKISFSSLNKENGLPNNTVNDILRDNYGFIWIATNDGLCRYETPDRMKVYSSNDPSIVDGLRKSNIRSIYVDKKNNLWVGTRLGGLSRLNLATSTWKTFVHNPDDKNSISNNEILCITEDSKGNIWVGTENGLNFFDTKTELFTSFQAEKNNDFSLKRNAVLSILEDEKGWIWVGTWAGGINLLMPSKDGKIENSKFKRIQPLQNSGAQNIWKLYQDHQNRYWVGSFGNGLFLMQLPDNASNDFQKKNWNPTFHNYKSEHNLRSNAVQEIFQDSKNNLWIGTLDGISIVESSILPNVIKYNQPTSDSPNLKFSNFSFDPLNYKTLTNNNVYSIFEDKQGIIWVGTFGGVSKYSWFTNQFGVYELFDHLAKTLNSDNLFIQPDGSAWIGNAENGLLNYDFKTKKISRFNLANKSPFGKSSVTSVNSNDNKHLYIGTLEGVIILNLETDKAVSFPIPEWIKRDFNTITIRTIFADDDDDKIWLGSEQGLFILNKKSGIYKGYFHDPTDKNSISDNSISSIFKDSNNDFWISTFNGLNKVVNPQNEILTFNQIKHNPADSDNSIPSNQLTEIIEIDKELIIGTLNGMFSYNLNTKKSTEFNKDGEKFCVQSLVKSSDGNIWASTTEGIIFYNIKTKVFNAFEKADGLDDTAFLHGSKHVDADGHIYFGSRRGITKFHPDNIVKNTTPPDVYVTEVKTINKEGTSIVDATNKNEINLDYHTTYLSLNFAAINYNRPDKNQYAYKLEGFDEDWNYSNSSMAAVYTNLRYGEYKFRVKAANNDGVWNEIGTTLTINKKAAFWETPWFYLLCLAGIIFLSFLGLKFYTKNINDKNKALQEYNKNLNKEILERKKVEKALQEKDQYMEVLVEKRTEQLALKNEEVKSLLNKIKIRNEELEIEVEKRTQKLKESNQELLRSNTDLEQFAYSASHDLQEPLRVVGNFVGLLARQYKNQLDDTAFEYISFAVDAAQRMSEQIKNLLTYSKIGRDENRFQFSNLNDIVELKLFDLSEMIKDKNASIEVDELPNVYCESDQISIVFYNLINNGIKFNKKENPTIKISADEDALEGFWKFSVSDNGIGINPEYQSKIFEIFRQLNNKSDYKGTGIGLALCLKIVQRHGGKIWLDSKVGEGTTFYFTIKKELENKNILDEQKIKQSLLN